MKDKTSENKTSNRLLSLDAFRGLTMFLLIAEFTHLFEYFIDPTFNGTFLGFVGEQFHHHDWNGLHFWDLVQPYFMFIVGVAIPFSELNRLKKGESEEKVRKHAFIRSGLLLLFGWGLYCINAGKITFLFQNVLAQLAITYLIAFLIRNKSMSFQFIVSLLFIACNEIIYRVFPLEGFNQAFIPDHNFGAYIDMLISGELSSGHWVSFNAIPTTAHTIWGVIIGKLLLSQRSKKDILKFMIISGVLGLILGYSLDYFTPIIKRIATSSFVIVSGGWSILSFALFYWIIDIKNYKNWAKFSIIVGTNSLFIYLFAHVGGAELIKSVFKPFSDGLFSRLGDLPLNIITSIITLYVLWHLTYWLYKHKIFIKI